MPIGARIAFTPLWRRNQGLSWFLSLSWWLSQKTLSPYTVHKHFGICLLYDTSVDGHHHLINQPLFAWSWSHWRLKIRLSYVSWSTNLPVCLKVWIPLKAYAMHPVCSRQKLQLSDLSYWLHSWMWSWLHHWQLIAMRIPSCLRALWTEQSASLLWPQIVTFGSWSLRKVFHRFRAELSSVQQPLPHRFAKRREKQNTNQ